MLKFGSYCYVSGHVLLLRHWTTALIQRSFFIFYVAGVSMTMQVWYVNLLRILWDDWVLGNLICICSMVNLQVMEALVDRLVTWLERPDVESMGNQYGVVSTFFCVSIRFNHLPFLSHVYNWLIIIFWQYSIVFMQSPQIFHIYTPLSYKSMLPQGRMYSLSRLCVMTTGMWLK